MANKVLLKKSSVAGKIPTSSDLEYGEVAINYNDGALFYKRPDDSIDVLVSATTIYTRTQVNIATTSQTAVDSWDITKYTTAKYIISVQQGTDVQASEMLVIHDGTNVYQTEYGIIHNTPTQLVTLSTDIDSGMVRLLATPVSPVDVIINIKRTLTEI